MALTLYPAIDLKDGNCVRLRQGEMHRATVYAADPAAQARAWQEAGFGWLHIVDLNGAFAGKPVNAEAIRSILGAPPFPCSWAAASATWRALQAGSMRACAG